MKKLLIVSIITLMGASLGATAAPNAKKIANGKFLFEDWGCKACHGIGATYNQDAEKGPNLSGVFSSTFSSSVNKI